MGFPNTSPAFMGLGKPRSFSNWITLGYSPAVHMTVRKKLPQVEIEKILLQHTEEITR